MEEAIADLEGIREAVGVGTWIVVGHSWGCDLGVRYAVEHPEAVTAVVGIAGKGPQRDRTWSGRTKPAGPLSPSSTSNGRPTCTRLSAIRSPIGFTDPIYGADSPPATCRCTSSPLETTSGHRGPWRSLPHSFRTEGSRPCQTYRMTFGLPTPRCGPRPSQAPAPPRNPLVSPVIWLRRDCEYHRHGRATGPLRHTIPSSTMHSTSRVRNGVSSHEGRQGSGGRLGDTDGARHPGRGGELRLRHPQADQRAVRWRAGLDRGAALPVAAPA